MKTSKSTKRALLLSVCSILLCLVMLIGTTFAWFTDTASTAVNTIQSGTLDIVLEMKKADGTWESAEGKTLDFVKAAGHENEAILWEPGCTYTLPTLRIRNNGSLALKYKVQINGIQGDATLNEAIVWTVSSAADTYDLAAEHYLPAKTGEDAPADYLTISGHMKEEAGNEYQGLTISGASIIVYATQYTYEYDSNNNTYDKNATYAVADGNSFKAALEAGGDVVLGSNLTADETKGTSADRILITKPVDLMLNATYTVPGALEDSSNWAALYIAADTTINASENGGITCPEKTDPNASYAGGPFVANVMKGATVTVNGGTYYGGGTTFQVETGTLIVNGGFFAVYPDIGTKDYRYVLNCIDANYKNGTAKIIVKGGTFVNFDPSNNAAEGAGTNFVAPGYTVVSERKDNGDFWYTVVPPTVTVGDQTYDTLEEAMNNSNGAPIVLNEDVQTKSGYKIKNDVVLDLNGHTWTLGDNSGVQNGANLTVSNGKVLGATYSGYIDVRPGSGKESTVTFTNVEFENTYKVGSKAGGSSTTYTDYVLKFNGSAGDVLNLTFTGCSFKNAAIKLDGYSNGGNETVLFDNCTFNCLTNSEIIEGNAYNTGNITVRDCSFYTITTTNMTVIDLSREKNVALHFEGTNTFDGRVATKEDQVGELELKLYSTQSIKAYAAKTVTGAENVTKLNLVN